MLWRRERHVWSYVLFVVVYFQPPVDRADYEDFIDTQLASRLLVHVLVLIESV